MGASYIVIRAKKQTDNAEEMGKMFDKLVETLIEEGWILIRKSSMKEER